MTTFRPARAAAEILALLEEQGCERASDAVQALVIAEGLAGEAFVDDQARRQRRGRRRGRTFSVERELAERFRAIGKKAATQKDNVLLALCCLAEIGEPNSTARDVGDVSEQLGFYIGDRKNVGARLQEWEEEGLTTRNPDEGRLIKWELTDHGYRRCVELAEAAGEVQILSDK